MSCIDSAIIKALVEHIGLNPDDSTESDIFDISNCNRLGVTVKSHDESGMLISFHYATVKVGDIFVFEHAVEGKRNGMIVSFVNKQYLAVVLKFENGIFSHFEFRWDDDKQGYFCEDAKTSFILPLNNITTGFFETNTPLNHPTVLEYFIYYYPQAKFLETFFRKKEEDKLAARIKALEDALLTQ